ncbi:twin-arginine translocation signal domain-containing protein [Capnocytophaga haemolytica]|uniref:twin-arginine translocation signal domain-containing protein n=1 Tax=Capnocytophaga haemolytica TaxID=45243 RepID=UPI001177A28C
MNRRNFIAASALATAGMGLPYRNGSEDQKTPFKAAYSPRRALYLARPICTRNKVPYWAKWRCFSCQ